jgi:hypothetical protein
MFCMAFNGTATLKLVVNNPPRITIKEEAA